MYADGLLFLKTFVNLLALQYFRYSKFRRETNKVFSRHLRRPARVEIDYGFLRIENFEDLSFVSLGIALNVGASKRRTRDRAARGVANHPGEIPDEKNHRVAQVLEMLELANEHCVPHVKIRRRGIKARLHSHRFAGLEGILQALAQLAIMDELRRRLLVV